MQARLTYKTPLHGTSNRFILDSLSHKAVAYDVISTAANRGTTMRQQAIRTYWIGSCLAVLEAFVLFILGLELR